MMAQENRYPSPDPTNTTHPYHNSQQQLPPEQNQHLHHAPTAMMHDHTNDDSTLPQGLQYIAQYGPPQPSTPQQLAQQGLDMDGHNTDPSGKKKTKVSRACDECRRKKVRCDAESDQPGVQCGNCKRANTTCQFSRQPQKRGPSKGYIKELAERVSRLEYPGATPPDLQYPSMSHAIPQADQQIYSPNLDYNAPNQRKRTHSMTDGPQTYLQGQDQVPEYARGSAHVTNVAFPGTNKTVIQAPVYDLPRHTRGAVTGLGPGDLEGYYGWIHTTLPLLPDTHFELQSVLDRVSPNVREAFKAALAVAVKAGQAAVNESQAMTAADLCLAVKMNRSKDSSMYQNLVHLQALILMAIADELSGPVSSQNANWLGSAVTLANSLHLQKVQYTENISSSDVTRLSRRVWLSLLVLDRWHAAGICSATLIHDENAHLVPSDHALLGSTPYHILRISIALGHLCNAFLYHEQDFADKRPSGRVMVELMRGEVQRIEESIEPLLPQMPLVHLALLHIKILSDKAVETFYSSDTPVIDAAIHTINLLRTDQQTASPLEHHFAGLAANSLILALELEPASSAEALSHLRHICETGRLPPPWRSSINAYISSRLEAHRSRGAIAGPDLNRGGLQHLADAAIGANRQTPPERIDWTTITSKGYLRAFE